MSRINNYLQIEVSWDEKLLKRRTAPQSVSITTKDFFTKYYPRLYDWDWKTYFSNREGFYKIIPSPLTGKLWYKGPIDFMEACYTRQGMIACVSKKVKDIIIGLNGSEREFIFHPIRIFGEDDIFYILFVPFLSVEELGINYHYSIFGTKNIKTDEKTIVSFYDDQTLDEYVSDNDNPLLTFNLVLNPAIKNRDVINAGYIHGYTYFSDRIVNAFEENHIVGYEVLKPGTLGTCPLSFSE
jgi:hypothetical protein